MCGIAGIFGRDWSQSQLNAMVAIQRHRGPDGDGIYIDPKHVAGLAHNRLKIIDLSDAGRQPMSDPAGRYHITFNGEIYNYLELREELNHSFRTRTDTEVLLKAFAEWGEGCLDRLIGMFSFAIWDERTKRLFAARDRFGVKPLYYHERSDGTLILASEIKALHAAGVPAYPDEASWATYLAYGLSDHAEGTFWEGIRILPPGHSLSWQDGRLSVSPWYDLASRTGDRFDARPIADVQEEYVELLKESVKLRFRSDVPAGINLSGGLDSSTLLGLVHAVQGNDSDVKAFTFTTGDAQYDELPWVRQMLDRTKHELVECHLTANDVPDLAEAVQISQDEPFGGLPTLAYARIFERARSEGVIVLLDGNGMDEQWAGYDYYRSANGTDATVVQGTRESPTRPECLLPEFMSKANQFRPPAYFHDSLRNLQYRDAHHTKIPRAMRFNDRISMRASTELREPFLDHRLFELALRQSRERKIANGTSKWLLRQITKQLLPEGVVEAPKRPLQTPQREWLRGPLRGWASERIEDALAAYGGSWLNTQKVNAEWKMYCAVESDNSFYVWQWVSLGLMVERTVLTAHE